MSESESGEGFSPSEGNEDDISRREFGRLLSTVGAGALVAELVAACAPSKEELATEEKLREEGITFTNADVTNNVTKLIPGVDFSQAELSNARDNWNQYGFAVGPDVPSAGPLDDDFYETTQGGGIGFFPGKPPIFYPKPSSTGKSPPVRSFLLTKAYDSRTPITVATALNKTVPGAAVWLSTPPPDQDEWHDEGKQSLWLNIEMTAKHHEVDLVVSYNNPPQKAA